MLSHPLYDIQLRLVRLALAGILAYIGHCVLVKNVGLRGKNKLANRWGDHIYVVIEKPNEDIPVFVVKREDRHGSKRTLHRNLLLPVNFLPLSPKLQKSTNDPGRGTIPSPRETVPKRNQTLDTDNNQFDDASESSDSDDGSEGDGTTRYFLRSRLNPDAMEFNPRQQPGTPAQVPTPAPDRPLLACVDRPVDVPNIHQEEMIGQHEAEDDNGEGETDPLSEDEVLEGDSGDDESADSLDESQDRAGDNRSPDVAEAGILPPVPPPRVTPVPALRRSTRERHKPDRFTPSSYQQGHIQQGTVESDKLQKMKVVLEQYTSGVQTIAAGFM